MLPQIWCNSCIQLSISKLQCLCLLSLSNMASFSPHWKEGLISIIFVIMKVKRYHLKRSNFLLLPHNVKLTVVFRHQYQIVTKAKWPFKNAKKIFYKKCIFRYNSMMQMYSLKNCIWQLPDSHKTCTRTFCIANGLHCSESVAFQIMQPVSGCCGTKRLLFLNIFSYLYIYIQRPPLIKK